jgi:hypothetical protein
VTCSAATVRRRHAQHRADQELLATGPSPAHLVQIDLIGSAVGGGASGEHRRH